jgi:glycerol-3-phosphate acyltransferase PlsX
LARIALDAMGGDLAPRAPVTGALLALAEIDRAHHIQLVGQSAVIGALLDELLATPEFASLKDQRQRLEIVEAPDTIEMSEKPTQAIRSKPKSYMVVGL